MLPWLIVQFRACQSFRLPVEREWSEERDQPADYSLLQDLNCTSVRRTDCKDCTAGCKAVEQRACCKPGNHERCTAVGLRGIRETDCKPVERRTGDARLRMDCNPDPPRDYSPDPQTDCILGQTTDCSLDCSRADDCNRLKLTTNYRWVQLDE